MSGYDSYTTEELDAMVESIDKARRYELSIADGTDLRATIAMANVRELGRQIGEINKVRWSRK